MQSHSPTKNFPLSVVVGEIWTSYLIYFSLGPLDPLPQTAARSPRPFLHNTCSLSTDRQNEHRNRPLMRNSHRRRDTLDKTMELSCAGRCESAFTLYLTERRGLTTIKIDQSMKIMMIMTLIHASVSQEASMRRAEVTHFATISAFNLILKLHWFDLLLHPCEECESCDEYVCLSVCLSARITRKP